MNVSWVCLARPVRGSGKMDAIQFCRLHFLSAAWLFTQIMIHRGGGRVEEGVDPPPPPPGGVPGSELQGEGLSYFFIVLTIF